ncbi:hypothetical protein Afil01_38430 [Actinorhabdospora filicis]|uniref:Uncharacterized protein n=1 Tax=Actinorhabdospora filicis TaxID=1785913 RepID=A0A9W6SN95_9ACTN|nr:hypothetical protein [Actinorhabdospora filicis]GLZ79036.1 hypothetical protein Afil01_38430 [Actinorhabdospora filicis]
MNLEDIDGELRRHEHARRKIAEDLYALDNHPARAFLRDGDLTGETRAVAGDTDARMSALWSQFTSLGAALDRAKDVRATRPKPGDAAASELALILTDEVVSLTADGHNPAETGAEVTERVTLAELTSRMNVSTGAVKAAYKRVDDACATVADRLAALTGAIDDAERLAELLGTGDDAGLPSLQRELTTARAATLADPLDAGALATLDHLTARVTPVLDALAELDRLRTGLPEALLERRTAIAALAEAEREASEGAAVATVKIADVRLPPLVSRAPTLRQELSDVRRLAAAARWGQVRARLSAVDAAVAAATAVAEELRETAAALMERRAELRGRLTAYQAKAGRVGAAERADVTATYETARALLWTAPCDLRAATRAVREFQKALLSSEETA